MKHHSVLALFAVLTLVSMPSGDGGGGKSRSEVERRRLPRPIGTRAP